MGGAGRLGSWGGEERDGGYRCDRQLPWTRDRVGWQIRREVGGVWEGTCCCSRHPGVEGVGTVTLPPVFRWHTASTPVLVVLLVLTDKCLITFLTMLRRLRS